MNFYDVFVDGFALSYLENAFKLDHRLLVFGFALEDLQQRIVAFQPEPEPISRLDLEDPKSILNFLFFVAALRPKIDLCRIIWLGVDGAALKRVAIEDPVGLRELISHNGKRVLFAIRRNRREA